MLREFIENLRAAGIDLLAGWYHGAELANPRFGHRGVESRKSFVPVTSRIQFFGPVGQ
jgi:hypothetical protein